MENKLSDHEVKRLAFINRQPTLWRHGCPVVELEPTDDPDDETIHVSPLFLEPLNADLDGDTNALYVIHDTGALREVEEKAFLMNTIHYDQNDNFLATVRHEALYAAFVLTKQKFNKDDIIFYNLEHLKDLPENFNLWNESLYSAVQMKSGELYSYGVCLFNKFCGFDKVIITKSLGKKLINEINEKIYNYYNRDNKKYYNSLTNLEKQLFFFISTTIHTPSLDIEEMADLKDELTDKIFKQLPNNNIKLGYHIVEALTDKCIDAMSENSGLYKLFKSGSRFSRAQLARSAITIGYSADAENKVIARPIKSSLLEGLTEEQYFRVAPATRKSIKDKSKHTPSSGYLERTLVMALSMIEFDLDDCETDNHLEFIVMSKDHAQTLVGKYYSDPSEQEINWEELDLKTAISYVNKKIRVRSPMTCINPNFKICRKCFGSKHLLTKYIGIVAGQLVTERLTQLTLRTFHESGHATLVVDKEIVKFFEDHLIDVETRLDIKTNQEVTTLKFDTDQFPAQLITYGQAKPMIYGFKEVLNNTLIFGEDHYTIENQDVISVVNDIKAILRQGPVTTGVVPYYVALMTALLEVGNIYSSFVEILFTNMFLVDQAKKVFWRYRQDLVPNYKLGDKMMAAYISSRIGLLYQPNKNTIEQVDLEELDEVDLENLTIYEKIYLGRV
jgi:hypothetical protein